MHSTSVKMADDRLLDDCNKGQCDGSTGGTEAHCDGLPFLGFQLSALLGSSVEALVTVLMSRRVEDILTSIQM